MNNDSAAAKPHFLPVGEARDHYDLAREVSETRGEFRTLKWASALAFVAIVGTMAFFYQALETFHQGQNDLRETLGAIHKQTELLSEHLFDQDEQLERLDGRLRGVENGVVQVNARLDQVDGRISKVEKGLEQVNGRLDGVDDRLDGMDGRLDGMDGRHEQMDARLGNIEDLLRVLVARSTDPS